MPKRNYGQAKREREAARQKKKAAKEQRKLERSGPPDGDTDLAEDTAPQVPPSK